MIAGQLEILMFANISRLSDDMRKAERVVGDSMGKVEKSVASAKQAMQSLGTGLSIGVIANTLRGISDSYTKLDAQLRLSTKSQQSYNQALADIRHISQVAQADISATSMLYTRMMNTMEGTGVSQRKLATVTETITFGLKAYGATSAEAASASLQLSQAMGANRLGGEEFRAVMEAMPNVMKVLATSMGVSIGELRNLSIAGKITAAEMVKAWGNPEIAAQFRKYAENAQTITGAMTNVRNELLLLVGEFSKATGFTSSTIAVFNGLASVIRVIADNMNVLVNVFLAYVTIVGVKFIQSIVSARMAQMALNAAHGEALVMNVAFAKTNLNMTAGYVSQTAALRELAAAEKLHAAGTLTTTDRIKGAVGTSGWIGMALFGVWTVYDFLTGMQKVRDGAKETSDAMANMTFAQLENARQLLIAENAVMKSRPWAKFNERDIRANEDAIGAYTQAMDRLKKSEDAQTTAAPAAATDAWRKFHATKKELQQMEIAELNKRYLAEVASAGNSADAQLKLAREYKAKYDDIMAGKGRGTSEANPMERMRIDLAAANAAEVSGRMSNVEKAQAAWDKYTEHRAITEEMLRDKEAALTQARIADWHMLRDKIASSLTSGIMQGFENGASASKIFEDMTKRMFKDMVLEPQIKATVTAGVDWVHKMVILTMSNERLAASVDANTGSRGSADAAGTSGAGIAGAAALFWGVFAVVGVKAYRSLTNEQTVRTSGITGVVTMSGARGMEYSDVNRIASGFQKLFGDDGSYTRTLKEFSGQQRLQLDAVFSAAKSTVLGFADTLNLSTSALENFSMTFDIVGGSFSALSAQITDRMAYALLGINYDAVQRSIMQPYAQRLAEFVARGGKPTPAVVQAVWDEMLTAALNSRLPSWFKDLQREGEKVGETLVRVTNEIHAVDSMWKNLGFDVVRSFGQLNDAFGTVRQSSVLAREAVINAMGGLDSFNAKMSTFYDKFYTDSEKLKNAQSNVSEAFTKLGIATPSTYAEFRKIVAGLDLTTQAGRESFAALMAVSGAFATVQDAAAALAKQQRSLDIRLQEALGNSEAALAMRRADELAAADESLRSTLRLIYAAEDRAKAENAAADAAQKLIDKVKGMRNMFGTLTDYNRALGLAGTRTAIATPPLLNSVPPEMSIMPITRPMPGSMDIWRIGSGGMRAFANGGDHYGGLRIVGENGPEIEATGPSRIYNANQTRAVLAGSDGNAELAAEVRGLRADLRASQGAIALSSEKSRKILDKFDKQGLPAERVI